MRKEENCLKCQGEKQVHGSRWCRHCWYSGIDETYAEYQDMISEGYRRSDAAIRSGWKGAEEI